MRIIGASKKVLLGVGQNPEKKEGLWIDPIQMKITFLSASLPKLKLQLHRHYIPDQSQVGIECSSILARFTFTLDIFRGVNIRIIRVATLHTNKTSLGLTILRISMTTLKTSLACVLRIDALKDTPLCF
jgi:hypothetical protein